MAYTTLAAWDFRGAGTAATKRVAVIGGYTLTEFGTPDWSAEGVDFSDDTADRLQLTLPAELKVGFPWIIGGFRVTGSNPGDDAHLFSLMLNNTGALDMSLGVLRAPNGQAFSRAAISGSSTGGTNHGVIPADSNCTLALYKTGLGVNNPGFRGRLNANAWNSFLVYNAGIDYSATSRLVFGSTNGQNARLRMHWFAMGSGDITEEELETIAADPSVIFGQSTTGRRRPRIVGAPRRRRMDRTTTAHAAVMSGASISPAAVPSLMGLPWKVSFPRVPSYTVRFLP